ncbi:hypothetical protein B0A48_09356 [Cryoendolithus antarcticus]|uniref:Karyogamy protein n=1 Tax=Cryoendolithus antarcticus TaxID=1507870 RepID=A0A1V8SZD0_9PEZI|nr:hypothetical protein B0A48_09356 [Cryoendolithus antarcticus]
MPSRRGGGGGGGVRLSGGPALSETEMSSSVLESDINSSPISLGTRLVLSDSEDDLADTHKYRMPDMGKTRLHIRTKEPMSPNPRHGRGSPRDVTTPTTPRSIRNGRAATFTNGSPRAGRSTVVLDDSPRGSISLKGSGDNVSDSDFVNSGLSRAGSIYSLSRVSFTGQLSQLTSMRLPDANTLARRMSSIPTATEAAKALSDASEQILLWISKAAEVLAGLDSEDDVEWAAAGGREGIEEVDAAIDRFERLVQVYIVSIERLQTRDDVAKLSVAALRENVTQLERVIVAWKQIKETLKSIKVQVEIAMEWQELWDTVLGEIGQEMDSLDRLVFQMEEKRHEGVFAVGGSIDLTELETIVEEKPKAGDRARNRFSMPPPFSPSSPIHTPDTEENKDDSSLLALYARMQPLRASLDFLPMRLSTFHGRGSANFPTACEDLEHRRDTLEAQWKRLEGDAESLRRELGEDRWVSVFRNAGRQALKMCESVSRSFKKLKEHMDAGEFLSNPLAVNKMVENYDAKKLHYGPAIERVLAIIDRGVTDRLTVNGEILRLQADMKRRWSSLQADMRDLDAALEGLNDAREKQLRDSVSTVLSSERSVNGSLLDGTPGSSPASSVALAQCRSPGIVQLDPNAHAADAINTLCRKPDNRPRFVSAAKSESRDFAPLSKFEPSPYAKTPVEKKPYAPRFPSLTPPSMIDRRMTPSRNFSAPVTQPNTASRRPQSRLELLPRKSSLPMPTTPSARPGSAATFKYPSSNLRYASGGSIGYARTYDAVGSTPEMPLEQTTDGNEADCESPLASALRRPPSSLEQSGRRSSMLPARSASRFGEGSIGMATGDKHKPRWKG